MKFVISTQELNYLINKIQNVVSAKPMIPILSNFLIVAANGKLTLTATDLTVGIECSTEVNIIEEGATTLPTKRFSQLIREFTSANIELSCSSNEITEIVSGASRFKINGMSRAEFPALPDLDNAIQIQIKQNLLKEMLTCTAFAVSRDDARFALTGVHMQIGNGIATFTGTDGKRLSRSHMSVDIDPSISANVVIPLKAVEEIVKTLLDEEEATLYVMSDKIAVKAGDTLIISKLLSGEYPDVSKVIPEKSDIVMSLHREELIALLRQVSLFTTEERHSARFSFTDGELNLNSNTTDLGEGKVDMPVNYHGPALDIAFNPHYFLDILRHCTGETVSLGIIDAFNPGIVTNEGSATCPQINASPLYMIMPLRLAE